MARRPPYAALPILTLAAGLAIALSGCAPEAAPVSEPDIAPGTASPAATPSPDPLDSVTAVVIRPGGLDLVDAGGAVVAEHSFDDDAVAIVETLATVFGSGAEIEEVAGVCCEAPRMTIYHWDGFQVMDDHMGYFTDDDERNWIDEVGPDVHEMNVRVAAETAAVGGVAVTAGDGFAIGDDIDALDGRVDHAGGPDWVQVPLETGPELGPEMIEGMPNAYSVIVQVAGPAAEPQLVAPVNLGAHTV
ncbi:hypothetical protein [Agromyces sp. ZXT2-6]|uniref:hypothetical protein n=1 Tax=Agromyces sp. ZXT2-6 TaxID=3461153 RepID=UPI004054DF93